MPQYYVGLDFGTHQSKVCIKDTSTNPASFEFLEFEDGSALFPSLVQINKNGRVSYGFADISKCKKSETQKLSIEEFPEKCPVLSLPLKPKKVKTNSFKLESYEALTAMVLNKNDPKYLKKIKKEWEIECIRIKEAHEKEVADWLKRKEKFDCRRKDLEFQKRLSYCVRYFKLACFNDQYAIRFNNEYALKCDMVSQWYLTFLLFKIEEKIGSDYFLQMGIPSGINKIEFEKQKNRAFNLLISAYELMKHFKSLKNFLKSDFRELMSFSTSKTYKDIFNYPFEALPEAYSTLQSLVRNGKLKGGIYLLVDIGGGTSDIALFNVNLGSKEPTIYSVRSFALGLNDLYEKYIELSNSSLSISEVQALFKKQKKCQYMIKSIDDYHQNLLNHLNYIIVSLEKSFQKSNTARRPIDSLWNAIRFQVKVFSGGGSMNMHMTTFNFKVFKDSITIDKDIIAHNSIFTNKPNKYEKIFPILANAYGLTEFSPNNIQEESMDSLFNHLRGHKSEKEITKSTYSKNWRHDDTDWW